MDILNKGLHEFIGLCFAQKDKKRCELLFDLFLTQEEKVDLGMRVLIIKALLKKEKTQREIAKELKVSIVKITRGSNELKRLDPKFLAYLKETLEK